MEGPLALFCLLAALVLSNGASVGELRDDVTCSELFTITRDVNNNPSIACQYSCNEWTTGIVHKKLPDLEGDGKMVEIFFTPGQDPVCKLIPVMTNSDVKDKICGTITHEPGGITLTELVSTTPHTPISTPGSPISTPPSTPGSPISTPPSTPGSPISTPPSTPGSPISTPPSTPGSPVSTPPSTPGSPVSKPPSTPGSPVSTPPSTPGSPISTPPSTPGSPISTPPSTPGSPISTPPSTPGSPVSTPPSTPGSPISTPPSTPGSPISTPPTTPGSPISTPPSTPGSPISKPPSTPGSPISTPPSTPGSPISTPPSTPGSPISTPPSTPGSPISTPPSTPGSPVSTPPSTPGSLVSTPPSTPGSPISITTTVPPTTANPIDCIDGKVAPALPFECEEGWLQHKGECLLLPEEEVSFDDAEALCSSNGGSLAKIDTKEQWAFVVSKLEGDTWVGLSDRDEEGVFRWTSDGSIFETNELWGANEPNNVGNEDCVHFFEKKDYLFNDMDCSEKLRVVCKKEAAFKGKSACGAGWLPHQDSCFFISDDVGTWAEGQQYCEAHDATYAKITNQPMSEFISRQLTGDTWFGMSDGAQEGKFIWSQDDTELYTNWLKDQPDNYEDKEDCVHFVADQNAGWNDNTCDTKYNALCEKPVVEDMCPEGWSRLDDSCYLVSDTTGTWSEGRAYCQGLQAEYAKVTSDTQQQFIKGMVRVNTWFGLNDIDRQGRFKWSSDNTQLFSRWEENQPDDSQGNEDCVQLRKNFDYKWNDFVCDQKNRYVCQRTAESLLSPAVEVVCEDDAFYFEGQCYHVSTAKGTWQEGKQYCADREASYAKVSRAEEWAFLASLAKDNTWVGYSDLEKEGTFQWDKDSSYDYTRWQGDNPDNYEGEEHCVHYSTGSSDLLWNDWTCGNEIKYLCERDAEDGQCPEGYFSFEDSCYIISTDEKNWRDSLKACEDKGDYFAKITSEREDNFIRSHVSGHTWFGLSDLDREGHFKWAKDGEVIFNKWGEGEPNDHQGKEDCAHLWKNNDYLLNDHQCSMEFNFACTEDPKVTIVTGNLVR